MDFLRTYLGSKKVRAMLFGLIVGYATKYGLRVDTETVAILLSPVISYILAQGQADKGKEAAKIAAGGGATIQSS